MKKNLGIFWYSLLLLLFLAETCFAQNIHTLKNNSSYTVVLSPEGADSWTVNGDKKAKSAVVCKVVDGVLTIENSPGKPPKTTPTILVSAGALRHIVLSGTGSVKNDLSIKQPLELDINGSGSADLQLSIKDSATVRLAGSGNVRLQGMCELMVVQMKGTGSLQAQDLACTEVRIALQGSGSAHVFADETLVVQLTGSGDVLYSGNPTLDTMVSGSGKLKPQP